MNDILLYITTLIKNMLLRTFPDNLIYLFWFDEPAQNIIDIFD